MSNKGRCTSSFNTNGLNTISFKQSRFNGSSANMSWRAEIKSPSSVKWLHGKTCPEHSVQYQGVSDKLIALNSSLEMGTHWIWYTESQSLHLSALLWVSTLCEQMLHFVNIVLFAIFEVLKSISFWCDTKGMSLVLIQHYPHVCHHCSSNMGYHIQRHSYQ